MIVVDWYLRLMVDKTIQDLAEPRLESFYPPFVAGIDLPHQGVVDFHNPTSVESNDQSNDIFTEKVTDNLTNRETLGGF